MLGILYFLCILALLIIVRSLLRQYLLTTRVRNPHKVIAAYGLDSYLTEKDDPFLWATVLLYHWETPDNYWLKAPELRFGVGQSLESDMILTKEWAFERVDERNLRAFDSSKIPVWQMHFPIKSLSIVRPSKDQSQVLVAIRKIQGPLAGKGSMFLWSRQENGHWKCDKHLTAWDM